ncbi:MAG: DUF3300 domain-containing protein [Ignavibacteriales bacterium]|nr:DUF3300 domain-containing protein [Ignavibacteriales bacterium]
MTFARLRDGLSYSGNVVLNVPGQNIQVVVQNSGYQRVAPAAPAAAPAAGRQARGRAVAASEAERLGRGPRHADRAHRAVPGCAGRADPGGVEGRRRRAEVRRLAEDEQRPQGHRAPGRRAEGRVRGPYIALAPFPQVVQMMVEKPDWTEAARRGLYERRAGRLPVHPAPARGGDGARQPEDHAAAGGGDRHQLHRPADHPRPARQPPGGLRPGLQHAGRLRAAGPSAARALGVVIGRCRRRAGRLHGGHHHRGLVESLLLRAVRVARRRRGLSLRV